jgi:vitamin B12 transporter
MLFGTLVSSRSRSSRLLGALALAALLAQAQAQAQSDSSPGTASTSSTLGAIVITPARQAQTVDQALSSVTIIDREALDAGQPQEFIDALRGLPGVTVLSNGPYGKNTSVFLRGTGTASSVLLIDGVRIRSATTGGAPWQFLPPQLLDRVEVVRGPRSSLYGADAVGGVIQAFTAPPDASWWAEAGVGSAATRDLAVGVGGGSGDTHYGVIGRVAETDGIRLREGSGRKGFDNLSGVARLNHRFAAGGDINLVALRSQGDTAFVEGVADYAIQVLGLQANLPPTAQWQPRLSISESRDESLTDDEFGRSRFDTRSRQLMLANSVYLGAHELVLGGEYLIDDISSSTPFDETSRYNRAGFGQLLLDFGSTRVEASLRHDDNEAFAGRTTGALAIGQELDARHRLRASLGTAYRAPTFNDLYFPGFSNPGLDPERSVNAELGVRGQYGRGFWDVAVFETRADDLIAFDAALSAPGNINRARIRGLEAAAGVRIEDVSLRASLTVQDPVDRDTGKRLARQTRQSARIDADYRFGHLTAGASLLLEGDRYNDVANTDRLASYERVDLRMGWRFARNWALSATVENLFDTDYAVASFFDGERYRTPGRSGFLRLRYGER